MKKINLVEDTIDKKDIDKLIEWLKTYPRLTKFKLTKEFEKKWSKFIGTKYSVFVNSGSSANLIMLYVLSLFKESKNKKIAIPNLAWATDYAPVVQLGFEPVLVDCNFKDLSVDIKHLEKVFKEDKPSCLLLVSVLGLVPNMEEIVDLCEKYNVTLLEDVCESLGSKYKNKNLGTFGLASTFSLYFGHHLSTIEGGMICTDDEDFYDLLIMARSHGWSRDLEKEKQIKLRKKWNITEFDDLYTFYIPGFNFRSTDLQAQIGIEQLKKVNKVIKKRNENFLKYMDLLKDTDVTLPELNEDKFVSNFCFPIIHKNRKEIIKSMQEHNIEVRPIIARSIGMQPMFIKEFGKKILPNSSIVDNLGIYVPNHPTLSNEDIKLICDIIKKHS